MLDIANKYRIRVADEWNVELYEYRLTTKRSGECVYEWKLEGYYGKVSQALSAVHDKMLRESICGEEVVNLEHLQKTIDQQIHSFKNIDVVYNKK